MSLGIGALLLLLSVFINLIICSILIARNNFSQKLLKEIKSGVQNIINELESRIVLADESKQDLAILLKEAKTLLEAHSATNQKKKTSAKKETTSPKIKLENINSDSGSEDDPRIFIRRMLEKNYSHKEIAETLGVSYEEIVILERKVLSPQ